MFLVFSLLSVIYFHPIVAQFTPNNGTFLYFAYGSNMLEKRIRIRNPSAVFISPARLDNYKLEFDMYMDSWNGAVATIIEDVETSVWGSLWLLDANHTKSLDEQEGVSLNQYYPKNVTVTRNDGLIVTARTYQLTQTPEPIAEEERPLERRPSNTYLAVLAFGAIKSHLPSNYIGFLLSFPTNGQKASAERRAELGYPFLQ